MRRIGVTGGIGSGKSLVCSVLSERMGWPIYYCDGEAKRLMAEDRTVRERLRKIVGNDNESALDKETLAAFVFASRENANLVSSAVHPAVRADFRRWCRRQEGSVVCVESAVLYESGLWADVDEVVFVDAPRALRLKRAMLRDKMTREAVAARMAVQDCASAIARADHIIHNGDGTTIEDITNQIKEKLLC